MSLHGLFFSNSSKGSFVCTITQTTRDRHFSEPALANRQLETEKKLTPDLMMCAILAHTKYYFPNYNYDHCY